MLKVTETIVVTGSKQGKNVVDPVDFHLNIQCA